MGKVLIENLDFSTLTDGEKIKLRLGFDHLYNNPKDGVHDIIQLEYTFPGVN